MAGSRLRLRFSQSQSGECLWAQSESRLCISSFGETIFFRDINVCLKRYNHINQSLQHMSAFIDPIERMILNVCIQQSMAEYQYKTLC